MASRRLVLRKTSGSDKDVDFRMAPRGDWDADQSGGHLMVRRAPEKRGHRFTTILSWISREFLRAGDDTEAIPWVAC